MNSTMNCLHRNLLWTFAFLLFLLISNANAQQTDLLNNQVSENRFLFNSENCNDLFFGKLRLHPGKISRTKNGQVESQMKREEMYVMDSAIVYSIKANPYRYIYTYSSHGDRLTMLIQRIQNEEWINTVFETATFDGLGNKTLSIIQVWTNNSWVNFSKETFTYYSSNMVSTSLKEIWNNGKWENKEKETFTYDFYGKLVAFLSETWFFGNWINNMHELYTYNEHNRLTDLFVEKWESGAWLNKEKYTYIYNSSDELITSIMQQWNSVAWINAYREYYSYNSIGLLASFIFEKWNLQNWEYVERSTYTYDQMELLAMEIGELFSSGNWIYYDRNDYTYDFYGGIQSLNKKFWNNTSWVDSSLSIYTYDSKGNAIKGLFYTWDGLEWKQSIDGNLSLSYNASNSKDIFVGYRVDAFYTLKSTGYEKRYEKQYFTVSCYPNPVIESSQILVSILRPEFVSIHICDLYGRIINKIFEGYLIQGNFSYRLPSAQVIPGQYFVVLTTHNRSMSYPFVKRAY